MRAAEAARYSLGYMILTMNIDQNGHISEIERKEGIWEREVCSLYLPRRAVVV